MEFRKIEGYDNYVIYENGDIINTEKNYKLTASFHKTSYYVCLRKNKKKQTINLLKIMYETYYNEKLTCNDIIKFKDEHSNNKFHYLNLQHFLFLFRLFDVAEQLFFNTKEPIATDCSHNGSFHKIANAYGIHSMCCASKLDLDDFIKEMMECKYPILCEFILRDGMVFPFVPSLRT